MSVGQVTSFTLNLLQSETAEVYLGPQHGQGGFFAWIRFDAAPSATIRIYLGPTADTLTLIPDLDMAVTDAGPHTYDIATRARFMKLEVVSGVGFNADVVISRR